MFHNHPSKPLVVDPVNDAKVLRFPLSHVASIERKVERFRLEAERTMHVAEAARIDERNRVQPIYWAAGCRFGLVVGWLLGVAFVAGALWLGHSLHLSPLIARLVA